jgi:acyl-CoA dehydrogenase
VFLKVAVSEELMRSGSGGFVASIGSLDIGLPPVWRMGSDALKDRVVPQVLSGDKIAALAITEPSGGSDVANLKTRAVRDGDHYVVNGSKTFITSGTRADYYTVAVRTGEPGFAGVSLLLIERGTPGFTQGKPLKKMGWWASDTAELFFEDCRVPVGNLLGPENSGFFTIMANFQAERLSLAIMAYMTAQLALWSSAWTTSSSAPRLASLCPNTRSSATNWLRWPRKVDVAREYAYRCAARMAGGQVRPSPKYPWPRTLPPQWPMMVTHEAVQIFGGMGFMRESLGGAPVSRQPHPVHRWRYT